MTGKGDKQLVEQLIQQIEQVRNESSAKDREIAEMRKQNADVQTALREERLQRETALGEERREKEELQQRLREQSSKLLN